MRQPKRILSIGGSDSGGSAGIQADLKTYEARGVFGCTALTALTAQATQGIKALHPLPLDFIRAQAVTVLDDIGADGLKTGFLGRAEVVGEVATLIQTYQLSNIVIDPVLVDGSGRALFDDATLKAYQKILIPLATVITPNLDEAALLIGMEISEMSNRDGLHEAARRLHDLGGEWVCLKGGHLQTGNTVLNIVYDGQTLTELSNPRLPVENPHGVGCTFAACIAAELVKGLAPLEAITCAGDYVQAALAGSLNWQLGRGRAALYHGVPTAKATF